MRRTMRATEGLFTPPTRRKLTGVGLASMLVLSILGAGTVTAATPQWTPGYGTDSAGAQPSSGASSTFVSPGKKVGFLEWLRNDDTSNISQLFLTATTRPAAGLVAAKWTIKSGAGVIVRSGPCPTVQPFKCGFCALSAGQTVYVTFAFTAPSVADGKPFDLDLLWSTTGV